MEKKMVGGDLSSLSPDDQTQMPTIIDHLQIRDSLRTYNGIVEKCFTDCVESFYRKTLHKQEEKCVMRCAEKFMKLSMRAGLRFAEVTQGADATRD